MAVLLGAAGVSYATTLATAQSSAATVIQACQDNPERAVPQGSSARARTCRSAL